MQVILPEEQIQQITLLISKLIQKTLLDLEQNSNYNSPFLNKEQACNYLSISNNTLDSWIKKGLPFNKVGRTIRFSKADITSWLQNQGGNLSMV